ncbi:GT-D fold domain-containing protein [Paenibacillus xanthanilyticus]|uniref:GT-D fold domain-containing glycosyltransferase n=1 Tax=Paenibacillus xanthanilyticus TaxID=1783531 RepID=A0ABV8JYJ0_9BACL
MEHEAQVPIDDPAAHPAAGVGEGRDAYEAGYERGLYEGGEQLLEQLVPPGALLEEIGLREVLAAGLAARAPQLYPLAEPALVYEELTHAIESKQPYALVRLGDGELLTLAQDTVFDAETIRREGRFLPYAGVTPPDLAARDLVAMAVRQANRVGVPVARRKHFQLLLHPVLRHHGIDPAGLRLTSSTINYGLQQSGLLPHLLTGRRLLLIGDKAPALAEALVSRGFTVTGIVSPVNGFAAIDRVIHEASFIEYDLALVSAGVPAVVICWRLATEFGRVALDFGHLADALGKGQLSV